VAGRDPATDPPRPARPRHGPPTGQITTDPRARRRRTPHPDQRTLPLAELATLDQVYGYSFIVTNLDVSTGEQAAAVEHCPDPSAALRHTAGLRRLYRLQMDLASRPPRCRLAALTRRPVERALPLGAALALAESGMPTTVRVPPQAALRIAEPIDV
jgi:hypothetical protein